MKKLDESRALLFAFLVSTVSLAATLTSAVVVGEQSQQSELENVNAEIVFQGRQIFVQHCAECHGIDARGYEGSDLHDLRARDPLLRQIITGGIKGEMPAYGSMLKDSEMSALINYLRSLRN